MPSILLTTLTAVVATTTLGAPKPAEHENVFQDNTTVQQENVAFEDKTLKSYYDELDESTKSELDYRTFERAYLDSQLSPAEYSKEIKRSISNPNPNDINKLIARLIPALFIDDARHIISNHRGSFPKPMAPAVMPLFDKYNLSMYWDQNHTMDFDITDKRNPDIPVYFEKDLLSTEAEKSSYVPSYSQYLMPGDIVWDSISSIPIDFGDFVTHMAIVVNPCKRGCYTDTNGVTHYFNFVETIEAFAGGVRFGFLDDARILECGTKVLRVRNASDTARRNAVEFCMNQYGEAYELNPIETPYLVPTSLRNSWYCTQLVFAAYFYQGYDLTFNSSEGFTLAPGGIISSPIRGDDIAASDYIEEVPFNTEFTNQFIKININGSHSFNFANGTSAKRTVKYAGSLYNFCDALENFRSITNQTVNIAAQSNKNVSISYNFLAGTVAAWYKENQAMYVTLAHYSHGRMVNSFIKTAEDSVEVKKNKNDTYTIKITNKSSYDKKYETPTKLLSREEAINKNYSLIKTAFAHAGETVSVSVDRSGSKIFVPVVVASAGRTNNAMLVRINLGDTVYSCTQPASVAKPLPEPEPEPYVSPYPKIDSFGETDYYFDFNDFSTMCHGGSEWYQVNAIVKIQDVLEWDWGSVEITEVVQDNDAEVWNDNVNYDYQTGEFSVRCETLNSNPTGCIRIRYTFKGSLYLNSISVEGNPKVDYFVGEQLDLSGITIHGQFTYGVDRIITNANGNLIIGSPNFDSEEPGEYTVCVEYTETDIVRATSYDVVVRYPEIISVDLSGYQENFWLGDEFNYDGLVATAYLEDGSVVEADSVVVDDTDIDMNCAGEYEVPVAVIVNDKLYSTSYTITVETSLLLSISLSGDYQTVFEVGDEFNSDGLIVAAHYANGNIREVTNYTIASRTVNMDNAGTYNVRVLYEENGVSVSTTYQITVVYNGPSLTSITLSGNYQRSFEMGEEFNYDGLIVTAHYSDGTSKVVTDYSVNAINYKPFKPGSYAIFVNYNDNGGSAVTSYSVTVCKIVTPTPVLTSITLSGDFSAAYGAIRPIKIKNLVVTAHYSDGSSAEVKNYVVDTSDVNYLVPGVYQARVLYTEGNVTAVATFDVKVGRHIIGKF